MERRRRAASGHQPRAASYRHDPAGTERSVSIGRQSSDAGDGQDDLLTLRGLVWDDHHDALRVSVVLPWISTFVCVLLCILEKNFRHSKQHFFHVIFVLSKERSHFLHGIARFIHCVVPFLLLGHRPISNCKAQVSPTVQLKRGSRDVLLREEHLRQEASPSYTKHKGQVFGGLQG